MQKYSVMDGVNRCIKHTLTEGGAACRVTNATTAISARQN